MIWSWIRLENQLSTKEQNEVDNWQGKFYDNISERKERI